jgi:shikimate kinase
MVITLIGYRGVGKSTIAPRLADRLNWNWIDADIEIEQRAGRTIAEIFQQEGEAGFRAREAGVLSDLLSRDRLVIAAGGGAILNPHTRATIRAAGPAIWLTASLDSIYTRLHGDSTTATRRPSLTGADPRVEIETVLNVRTPLYTETASLVVDTENRSPDSILDEIILALPGSLTNGGSR